MADVDMWTELVEPVELTGYARARLEDYERQQNGSLVSFLPNEFLNDIVAQFEVGQTGLQPVAEYIAYDTESPLASLPGAQKVMFELPKLGLKMSISEYEQIRARGNQTNVVLKTSVERITERLVDAISDRLEYERGYAIENASLLIDDETGFKQSGDWGRAPEHEVSADDNGGEFWDDESADPIENLLAWKEQYIATNGFGPGAMLTSTRGLTVLQRHPSLRALFSSVAGAPQIVTIAAVNETLAAYGLPPLAVYDRQVNFKGQVVKVLSPEYLFMLPSPGGTVGGVKLGATYWGTTLESYRPEYNIEELDRPGIVVGAWETRDPIAKWVHAAAIGLAVLGDANLSLRAQILPQGS
ncbi:major capsid protein [Mycobacterium phage Raela]|uniref:Major capsid protein n=1 Tax=Mycobacterium phage Raela TaxID=2499054 RepID=A0A3S9U904_9CAUD|nr:major capsid protein [Mycobacterium phage Raela]